jgi:Ca-activated chloride channel family protein|tara:strand:- start:1039 stop:2763 length:1725 start_codon:yes stop_codon:yes gene_type:complete
VQQVSDSDDGAKDATQPEPTDAAIQQVASPSAVAPAGAPAGAPAHIEDTVLQAEQAIVSREAPNRGKGESFAEQSHALVRLTSRLPRGYPQPAYNAAENYQTYAENSIKRAAEEPLSTFSIDVDTGAYSNMRRYLNLGQMPPVDAVRVEELINYFSYDYPIPQSTETPFSIYTEMAPSPWNKGKHLLHIGLQGFELPRNSMPASNLVFLIDVSGSMQAPNKLELVKSSLKLLTKQLSREDSIAIVTYAGSAGTVLEPVKGSDKAEIYAALDRLRAHGSTWGEGGIMAAYRLARTAFIDNGINRVVLATDGDFNVGIADVAELKKRIKRERESGIGLTTLGFGMGNYNDAMLEQLADVGNGNYAYIDNLNEARKVLVEEISSTLNTIASDVKIQIEFNPAIVSEYRLIGYENRLLKREDFNNDKVDAGEIGAGHSVTALYEIALKNSGSATIDPLRYQKDVPRSDRQNDAEIAFLKLRYKTPGETTSRLVTQTLLQEDIQPSMDNSSSDFKFAAAVSGFGQLLRASEYLTECNHASVIALAKAGQGPDRNGYRGEFIKLVELADALVLPIAQVSE